MAELILALDLPDEKQALDLLDQLKPELTWVKVGLELFLRAGPPLVSELKKRNFKVFLDLKFYDIPPTVAKAIESALELKVDLLTLHCQGGLRMLEEAVAKRGQSKLLLFGVTVLTSFAAGEIPEINLPPATFASKLALLASKAGLNGVVCSPQEVKKIKEANPALLCLCPGIRPKDSAAEDQRRVATPKEAVENGADYLVIGRPILKAANPRAALLRILDEMN
ncbi:MAG: orotidine-5'-phosphate decarboxylase [Desulfovibrio sp.]|nr:orotidine-5'-phosphate decarboxylase [Desulfovibrio sp.]